MKRNTFLIVVFFLTLGLSNMYWMCLLHHHMQNQHSYYSVLGRFWCFWCFHMDEVIP